MMQQPCSSITHLSSSSYDLLMEEEEEEMSHPRKEKTRHRHSDEDGRKSRKHKVAPSHGAAPQGASSGASSFLSQQRRSGSRDREHTHSRGWEQPEGPSREDRRPHSSSKKSRR